MELRSHALPDLSSDMLLVDADDDWGNGGAIMARKGVPATAQPLQKQRPQLQPRASPPAPQQPLMWTTRLVCIALGMECCRMGWSVALSPSDGHLGGVVVSGIERYCRI